MPQPFQLAHLVVGELARLIQGGPLNAGSLHEAVEQLHVTSSGRDAGDRLVRLRVLVDVCRWRHPRRRWRYQLRLNLGSDRQRLRDLVGEDEVAKRIERQWGGVGDTAGVTIPTPLVVLGIVFRVGRTRQDDEVARLVFDVDLGRHPIAMRADFLKDTFDVVESADRKREVEVRAPQRRDGLLDAEVGADFRAAYFVSASITRMLYSGPRRRSGTRDAPGRKPMLYLP